MKLIVCVFTILSLSFSLQVAAECEDKSPEQCRGVLQPHFCYVEHNRKLCCQTCRSYHTQNILCEYGDHYANIIRKSRSEGETQYTCEGYVTTHGRHICIAEQKFRETCCKSCAE